MSRLDEIRARVAKATPGPWESGRLLKDYDGDYMVWHGRDDEGQRQYVGSVGGLIEPVVPVGADILFEAERDNAEYIAHARADLPALLAVAEAATAYRETVDDFDALTQSRCPDDFEYENWERAQLAVANGYDALTAALDALEAGR